MSSNMKQFAFKTAVFCSSKPPISQIKQAVSNDSQSNFKIISINEGHWSEEEQRQFLEGLIKYGIRRHSRKSIISHVKTRSHNQIISFTQKFFLRIKKKIQSLYLIKKFSKNSEVLEQISIEFLKEGSKVGLDMSYVNLYKNKEEEFYYYFKKLFKVFLPTKHNNQNSSNFNKSLLDSSLNEEFREMNENLSLSKQSNSDLNSFFSFKDIDEEADDNQELKSNTYTSSYFPSCTNPSTNNLSYFQSAFNSSQSFKNLSEVSFPLNETQESKEENSVTKRVGSSETKNANLILNLNDFKGPNTNNSQIIGANSKTYDQMRNYYKKYNPRSRLVKPKNQKNNKYITNPLYKFNFSNIRFLNDIEPELKAKEQVNTIQINESSKEVLIDSVNSNIFESMLESKFVNIDHIKIEDDYLSNNFPSIFELNEEENKERSDNNLNEYKNMDFI